MRLEGAWLDFFSFLDLLLLFSLEERDFPSLDQTTDAIHHFRFRHSFSLPIESPVDTPFTNFRFECVLVFLLDLECWVQVALVDDSCPLFFQ